jgi:hypothetical protein
VCRGRYVARLDSSRTSCPVSPLQGSVVPVWRLASITPYTLIRDECRHSLHNVKFRVEIQTRKINIDFRVGMLATLPNRLTLLKTDTRLHKPALPPAVGPSVL